ncbi:hypothetical protein Tco_0679737 [Tanacetum coccineum]|uniref:Uncharacterized protein n=1 Tax=Tanacetum coccineum TaxID=301880 RepID=A0ABQ4XIN4_9ASTR
MQWLMKMLEIGGEKMFVQYEVNEVGQNGRFHIRCLQLSRRGIMPSNSHKHKKRDAAYLQQHLQNAQEEEAGSQSTQVEYEFMDMTKPITASQPNVIHRQQANSNSSGFSPTRVNNTAKTISPQPARVHSKSKSSCLSNNFEKLEENHRNSLIPKTQKHMSSECNNITLAIRNAKSEIICVMCKQCLVTANHDVCVLNYVNNMNFRAYNRSTNVSIRENQKKHKANAKKSKELGSKGSLASSRPSKPRTCLRWIPTGRIFAMCGKLTASSNTENKCEKSVCDNASTSNPLKPSSKGFPISTSLLGSWKVYWVICSTNTSNGENHVVLKSSVVTTPDASDKRQQQQDSTSSTSTLTTTISADGNFDLKRIFRKGRKTKPKTTKLGTEWKSYVNGMKSRKKNQSVNVSKSENQKKHKAEIWKPKNVGSKDRFASPKPSKPRSCLRWSPTGRLFDLKGKILTSSESVRPSDGSKGDNACTSNPQATDQKLVSSSTFSMDRCQIGLILC